MLDAIGVQATTLRKKANVTRENLMTVPAPGAPAPGDRPTIQLQIGPLKLLGPMALVVALCLLAGCTAWIVWSKPSLGMLLSGLLWFGFLMFWSSTARRGSSGTVAESSRVSTTRQSLMLLGLLLLFAPIPGLQWRYLPEDAPRALIGLSVQVTFALLHIWARMHLGRNWSSAVMIKTDQQLVRSGPYRFVRHPIYTAILGMAAGTAIVSAQVHGLLGLACIVAVYIRKIRLEEAVLSAAFGAEWSAYKRNSWALIPGLV